MARWAAGKQRLNQRSMRKVPVRVVGTIVRRHGDLHLAPVAVRVEVEVEGLSCLERARELLPLLNRGLGAELAHFLGERLVVSGRLVKVGAVLCLYVDSYRLGAELHHQKASVRGVYREGA